MDENEGFAPEQWTYIGTRFGETAGKLYDAWVPYVVKGQDETTCERDSVWYEVKKSGRSGLIVGHVFERQVRREDGRTLVRGNPEWSGRAASTPDLRALWGATSVAARARLHKLRKQKKLSHAQDMLEGLEPIRLAYQGTNADGQRALIAEVLALLQRRTPLV